MKAEKITKLTAKESDRILKKYSKKCLKGIYKEIKKASKEGHYKIYFAFDEPDTNIDVLDSIRTYVKECLTKNGYYVREYTWLKYDIWASNEYIVSWGKEIEHQRHIDEMHLRAIEEQKKKEAE